MFVITDRDRHHLLLQAQTAMGEPAADTLMASLYPGDPAEVATKSDLKVAIAGVLTKLAELEARLMAQVSDLHGKVSDLHGKISDLHDKIGETNNRISKLETKLWRMVVLILFGQAVLPPFVERVLGF